MAISQNTVGVTATVLYTSSGTSACSTIHLCNYGVDTTFTLWVVPNGGSADNSTIIYSAVPLNAGNTYVIDTERFFLDAGDTIQGLSVSGTVNASVVHIGV